MSNSFRGPVIIIGAGPTGLGAAYMLHRSGYDDWLLYEREDTVGGLSRSYRDERGFTWDIGGHVVFSHYGLFTRLLDTLLGPSDWLHHDRESWIRLLDRWVPYPFQNNIHRLPPEICAQCLEGLITAAMNGAHGPHANFDEFLVRTFGKGIVEVFMRPYNFKVWAYALEKLDCCWTGERVSVPDPVRVARNVVLQRDDTDWGPNNRFRFPARGGTGAIWTALAEQLPAAHCITRAEAVELDPQEKVVRFSNGDIQRYGALISTMPLDRLAAISGRKDWMDLASGLQHSAVHIVGVGLNGSPPPRMRAKCWMYFPEDSVPFYRVTHFSRYSPNNVDDIRVHWSLMAEVSESTEKPVDASTLAGDTVRGMVSAGLIGGEEQVSHVWTHCVEYGYPTPTLARNGILQRLLPQMQDVGILSRGRFGSWLYEVGNMDHSFMQGLEAAGHILHGTPELTLWHPNLINMPHPTIGWNLFR